MLPMAPMKPGLELLPEHSSVAVTVLRFRRRGSVRLSARRRPGDAQVELDVIRDLFLSLAGVDGEIAPFDFETGADDQQIAVLAGDACLELVFKERYLHRHRDGLRHA